MKIDKNSNNSNNNLCQPKLVIRRMDFSIIHVKLVLKIILKVIMLLQVQKDQVRIDRRKKMNKYNSSNNN